MSKKNNRQYRDNKGLYKQARRNKEIMQTVDLFGGAENYLAAQQSTRDERRAEKAAEARRERRNRERYGYDD